jgi:hypothetical protein
MNINWNAVYTVGAAALIIWRMGNGFGRLHGKLDELTGTVKGQERRLGKLQKALSCVWQAIGHLRGRVDTIVEFHGPGQRPSPIRHPPSPIPHPPSPIPHPPSPVPQPPAPA